MDISFSSESITAIFGLQVVDNNRVEFNSMKRVYELLIWLLSLSSDPTRSVICTVRFAFLSQFFFSIFSLSRALPV